MLSFFVMPTFFFVHRVWFHTRAPLQVGPDALNCCIRYIPGMYLCVQSVAAAAAIRYREPDGNICCWSIESDSSVFFLFIQTRFIFNAVLGSTCCRIYGLDLPVVHPR